MRVTIDLTFLLAPFLCEADEFEDPAPKLPSLEELFLDPPDPEAILTALSVPSMSSPMRKRPYCERRGGVRRVGELHTDTNPMTLLHLTSS